jgi:hypothetical protein
VIDPVIAEDSKHPSIEPGPRHPAAGVGERALAGSLDQIVRERLGAAEHQCKAPQSWQKSHQFLSYGCRHSCSALPVHIQTEKLVFLFHPQGQRFSKALLENFPSGAVSQQNGRPEWAARIVFREGNN